MSLVVNERIKLVANALDRAGTACFTVGIATPLAGYVYNVGGFGAALSLRDVGQVVFGWSLAIIALHLLGRHVLSGLRP